MKRPYKSLLAGISLIALTAAGCGTTGGSSPNSPTSNATSTNSTTGAAGGATSNLGSGSSNSATQVASSASASSQPSSSAGSGGSGSASVSLQSVTRSFGGTNATLQVPDGWQEKPVAVGNSGGYEWVNPSNPKQQLALISTRSVGSMQNAQGQWDVTGLFASTNVHWTWVGDNNLTGNFTNGSQQDPYNQQTPQTGYTAIGKAVVTPSPTPMGVFAEMWGPKGLANQVIPSLVVSSGSGATATSTALTLENLQFTSSALTVLTTHGNMPETLVNPHFTSTNPRQFVFTLRNVAPGKYALNQPISVQSNWASSVTITRQGTNLVFTCQLKSSLSKFTTAVGGGDMIEVLFS